MPYVDEQLSCAECGADFVFTAKEQERHAELGFENKPKRCFPCRQARKQRQGGGSQGSARREYHTAVCAECGGEARVPFKPNGNKPVYCSSCFKPRQ